MENLILVVDDDPVARDTFRKLLEHEGHKVVVAEDGQQAVGLIKTHDFRMIILDIEMPNVNGFEVLKTIRAKHPPQKRPVIMLSASDNSKDIVKAYDIGANDYITKPINIPVVLARIKAHLSMASGTDT